MADKVELEYLENRGGYGYAYFTDGTRLGWTPDNDAEIWPGNWGAVTGDHMRIAALALVKEGWLHEGPVKFRVNLPGLEIVTMEPSEMK